MQMRDAKRNFKDALKELKQEFKDEKFYADTRDTGLMERWIGNDEQYSLYKANFNNFHNSKDGKSYSVVIEQDKNKREGHFDHMTHIEFAEYTDGKIFYEYLKKSNITIIFSPATATKKGGE
jgi:hypothetical protein